MCFKACLILLLSYPISRNFFLNVFLSNSPFLRISIIDLVQGLAMIFLLGQGSASLHRASHTSFFYESYKKILWHHYKKINQNVLQNN